MYCLAMRVGPSSRRRDQRRPSSSSRPARCQRQSTGRLGLVARRSCRPSGRVDRPLRSVRSPSGGRRGAAGSGGGTGPGPAGTATAPAARGSSPSRRPGVSRRPTASTSLSPDSGSTGRMSGAVARRRAPTAVATAPGLPGSTAEMEFSPEANSPIADPGASLVDDIFPGSPRHTGGRLRRPRRGRPGAAPRSRSARETMPAGSDWDEYAASRPGLAMGEDIEHPGPATIAEGMGQSGRPGTIYGRKDEAAGTPRWVTAQTPGAAGGGPATRGAAPNAGIAPALRPRSRPPAHTRAPPRTGSPIVALAQSVIATRPGQLGAGHRRMIPWCAIVATRRRRPMPMWRPPRPTDGGGPAARPGTGEAAARP